MAEIKRGQLVTAVDRLREKLASADPRTAARQLERELVGYSVPDAAALVTAARQRLESELGKVRPKYSLHRVGRQDWYAGPRDNDIWSLLQQYLLAPHGKGWPESDVRSINDSSTDVMAQLDPPNQDGFSTAGLSSVAGTPRLSANPVLAREFAEGWRRCSDTIGGGNMECIRRNVTLNLLAARAVVSLDTLAPRALSALVDDYFRLAAENCGSSILS